MQDRDELIKESEEMEIRVPIASHYGRGNNQAILIVINHSEHALLNWFEVYQHGELVLKTINRIEAIDKYLSLEV